MPTTDEYRSVEELLDEWLDASLAELDDPPGDLDRAGKLLGAMRGIDRRIQEVEKLVSARIEELRAFRAAQIEPLERRRAWLEDQLEGFALAEHERTGRKTWPLPEGELNVRARRPQMRVDARIDLDDAVLDQIESALPGAIKKERSILVSKIVSDESAKVTFGDVIDGYPDVPEGYDARQVVVQLGDSIDARRTLEGVVMMVPRPGREGMKPSVKPGAGSKAEPW